MVSMARYRLTGLNKSYNGSIEVSTVQYDQHGSIMVKTVYQRSHGSTNVNMVEGISKRLDRGQNGSIEVNTAHRDQQERIIAGITIIGHRLNSWIISEVIRVYLFFCDGQWLH